MSQLVFIENGKTVTDSLTVAEVFGKKHKNVIRDIEQLGFSEEFSRLNFELSSYTNERGRTYPKYIMTQDGFTFLVMGYTGQEADCFKEMYIKAFNQLKEQVNKPSSPIKALLTATHQLLASQELLVERMDDIENKVENQITLNSGQQLRLQQAIKKKVCTIEPDKTERSELFRQIHREIKDRWQVPSYKDILRQDMQEVINYVKAWKPIKRNRELI